MAVARKVFFSFKYDDVNRAMIVRNSGVINADAKAGFIDHADFEKVQRQGDSAIKRWIDSQLDGSSVTVVLIGENTNKSKWVRYEIEKSIERGNGLIGIDISKVPDFNRPSTACCGNMLIGYDFYRWDADNGRENLSKWIEKAANDAGR
jgi:hypothetical protein